MLVKSGGLIPTFFFLGCIWKEKALAALRFLQPVVIFKWQREIKLLVR